MGIQTRHYRTVENTTTAQETWIALKKHHEGMGQTKQFAIVSQFFHESMKEDESPLVYIERLVLIARKLAMVDQKLTEFYLCGKIISSQCRFSVILKIE